MSTGLTWVVPLDINQAAPDLFTGPSQFSDYNEAYNFANWLVRLYDVLGYASASFRVAIYTTSPNSSGFWFVYQGSAEFQSFD